MLKSLQVLQTIHQLNRPSTRAEIAQASGLSQGTVSSTLTHLKRHGMVDIELVQEGRRRLTGMMRFSAKPTTSPMPSPSELISPS